MATQPKSNGVLTREQAKRRFIEVTAQRERDADVVNRYCESIERSAIQARALGRFFGESFPHGSAAIEKLGQEAAKVIAAMDAELQNPEFRGLVQLLRILREAQSDSVIAGSNAAAGLVAIMAQLVEGTTAGTKSPEQVLAPLKRVFVAEGVNKLFSDRAAKKHQNNRKASARIPELWAICKAEGKKKKVAATEIAAQINLSVATVRKKLQGL